MKPKITKQKAFGGDWYMFYCGNCGKTIDMNVKPRLDNCQKCNTEIDWRVK